MQKSNEKLQDKEWLKNQYEVQQKSLRTIAVEIGVTTPIVSKYVKRYGFKLRSAGESKSLTAKTKGPKSHSPDVNKTFTKEWLYQKYITEGLSTRDIVLLVGLKNRRTVKKALISHGISIRSLKDARQNRTKQGNCKKKPNQILINNKEDIISLYVAGESIRSIRHRFELSRDAIHGLLLENNLSLRNCNEANIGRKHSIETKEKMSKTAVSQIIGGTRSSHGNGNRLNCLTPNDGFITMRSSWEKKYAEYLKKNNVDFRYEPTSFPLSNGKSYVADFYLTSTNEFIEIKGYLSQDQSDKYELFKKEYPSLKWTILYKENLIDLGIDLKTETPTIYLLVGAPSAGKSWIASQLLDKFTYISYDGQRKKNHLDLLRATPTDRPILYDPTFKISTIIRRHSDEFNFILVGIYETEEVLRERMASRGGEFTTTIMKRNEVSKKRYNKYGTGGFLGTSSECLDFLKNIL